jgi:cytochrome P450
MQGVAPSVVTDSVSTEPLAASFDPFELQDTILGDIRDPFPVLAGARQRGGLQAGRPVFGDPLDQLSVSPGTPDFTAYSHEAVATVLRDGDTFSSSVYHDVVGAVMGHTVLEMDQPEHRAHRALVSQAFRAKTLARWEHGLIEMVIDQLIDAFEPTGRAELVRQFTFAFPVQVIAQILGLPRSDYPKFQRWSLELLSVSRDWQRGLTASAALRQYFSDVLADRRLHPADDLITDLSTAEIDGQRLSDDEIFAFLRLLLPAGVETTYRSSGNLLYGLLTHLDQLGVVAQDRSLLPQAIEEGLRWEPPILFIMRRATRDTEVDGVPIPAGAIVNVCVGSANRDQFRYRDPDRFDIFRDPQQHMTFGFGPHMCLGMHLARMETRIALSALLDRLPNVRLDPDHQPAYIQGVAFRSPAALHVRFD